MTRPEIISALTPAAIHAAITRAQQVLEQGGLVAFPTDTVYGLAVSANDRQGIERLYQVKERDLNKAIAVLLASPEDLGKVTAGMPPQAKILAESFWPGPLTLVVQRHPDLPDNISLLLTIGVRMPDHPVALALLRATGPLAVTSANLSGFSNTTSSGEVLKQLGERVDLIIDGGETNGGTPSTVVDCTQSEIVILRKGPISRTQIEHALTASEE